MLLPSLLDKLTQTWQTQLLDFTTIQHWRNKSGKFMFVIRNMNLLNYLTSQPSNTGGTNLDNSCLSSLTWTYSTTWLHNLPIPWSELRTSSAALFICCLHFFFNNFMMVWVGKSRFECSIDERWSQNKRPCGGFKQSSSCQNWKSVNAQPNWRNWTWLWLPSFAHRLMNLLQILEKTCSHALNLNSIN